MNKSARNILGCLLVALYVFFVVSTSLFVHSHHFADKIITHSHPYIPSGNRGLPNHSHSESQCLWIQLISSELFFAPPSVANIVVVFVLLISLHILAQKYKFSQLQSWLSPRAPPQVLFT